MVSTIIALVIFVAAIVLWLYSFVRQAINRDRDFAYRHPNDPYSQGLDAQWKGKGPPPSEQTFRAARIRWRSDFSFLGSLRNGGMPLPRQMQDDINASVEADLKEGDAIRAARRAKLAKDADKAPPQL